MDSSVSRAPRWAKVEGSLGYVSCPACELFLPHEPTGGEKQCPKCLRERGETVMMRPTPPDTDPSEGLGWAVAA